MSAVVDLVGDVGNAAQDGEVDQTPCPLDGSPELARLLRWGRRRIRVLALELAGDRLCPGGQGSSKGEGSEGSRRGPQDARCDSGLTGRKLAQRKSSRGGSHSFGSDGGAAAAKVGVQGKS